MVRSFLNISRADLGVKTTGLTTMLLNLPESRYPRKEAQVAFFDQLESRLKAVPNVDEITIASALPAGGSKRVQLELDGTPPVDEQQRPALSALTVGPRYFQTLGAAVLSGRDFDERDRLAGPPAVIVNQRFANAYWPGEDLLGKRLRLFAGDAPNPWLTVVGVVSNIVQNDANRLDFEPLMYSPVSTAAGELDVGDRACSPGARNDREHCAA